MKEGKGARGNGNFNNFLQEQVLNIDDSEDEDYELAATKRVNEAINCIL